MNRSILYFIFWALSSCTLWGEGPKKDPPHIEAVTCDPQFDAKEIRAQRKVIPQKLYHFTKRESLRKDIKEKYFSSAQWQASLSEPDWGLPVSDGIDSHPVGYDKDWVVQLMISADCQSPNRVATLLGLEQDPRFQKWFRTAGLLALGDIKSLDQFEEMCRPNPQIGVDGYKDFRCRRLVLHFIKDTKIAILQDHQVNKNFYLFNPACVESLRGTNEDMIQTLVDQEFWVASCSVDHFSEYVPYLLATSLVGVAQSPSPADLESLLQNIGLVRNESLRLELSKMLRGYLQCQGKEKLKKFQQSVEAANLKLKGSENFRWESKDCPGE